MLPDEEETLVRGHGSGRNGRTSHKSERQPNALPRDQGGGGRRGEKGDMDGAHLCSSRVKKGHPHREAFKMGRG